jgi:hypothetical protein
MRRFGVVVEEGSLSHGSRSFRPAGRCRNARIALKFASYRYAFATFSVEILKNIFEDNLYKSLEIASYKFKGAAGRSSAYLPYRILHFPFVMARHGPSVFRFLLTGGS